MLSSAIVTCAALRSASLYTATVGTPRRFAVAITRHAISPRFATTNLRISGGVLSKGGQVELWRRWGDAVLTADQGSFAHSGAAIVGHIAEGPGSARNNIDDVPP
jgi:hypothetical protein